MGNSPSTPSKEQAAELERQRTVSVERAAAAIASADVLLLATGAGWSADSGLAVYKDVANIPAYHERELTYHDLCEPHWLSDEPELFWGFWGMCFNDYRKSTPHEGYSIVRRWRDILAVRDANQRLRTFQEHCDVSPAAGNFFSFTSNVDAHHLQFFRAEEVRECHGNSETFQCANRDCAEALSAEADVAAGQASCCAGGRWAAPPGFRFQVDADSQLAAAGAPPAAAATAAVGQGVADAALPSCHVVSPEHWDGAFRCNHPRCLRCSGAARPAILMFSDGQWQDDVAQAERWTRWKSAVLAEAAACRASTTVGDDGGGGPLRVVIVEVGAGGNVTTVRGVSESLLKQCSAAGAVSTLVRINPDLPLADDTENQPHTISLAGYGLATVRAIDQAMKALTQMPRHKLLMEVDATPLPLTSAGVEPIDRAVVSTSSADTSNCASAAAIVDVEEDERVEPRQAEAAAAAAAAAARQQREAQARAVFERADSDGDGELDRAEVKAAGVLLGRCWLGDADVDAAMAAMDADGDGRVTFQEFKVWWEDDGRLSASEKLDAKWAAFGKRFDDVLSAALGQVPL
jgi:NAD-dependent SIR2 family protein deacetylase